MTKTTELPKVTAICPWFGSSRIIGEHVGKALEGCAHVTVPFAGGMCELAHITARTLLVNDLHLACINLATIAAHPMDGPKLYRRLRRTAFHEGVLAESQIWCAEHERGLPSFPSPEWAYHYFVACWMARNGEAGKANEFDAGFSFRRDPGGGDSAVRFRNATKSLIAWRLVLARATFICEDAFGVIEECKDSPECGVYVDPPWPDDGKAYKHSFRDDQHKQLRDALLRFKETRVVIRYGRHPLIERLYPSERWDWQEIEGRTSGNNKKAEVLITRRQTERSLF